MKSWLLASTLLIASLPAQAGKCDTLANRAKSDKGEKLVEGYVKLVACDAAEAETHLPAFQKATEGDVGLQTSLALAAIDAKRYTAVWAMLDGVKDYSARDDIAEQVGAACGEHPEVVTFLQGAYFGLRNTQFGKWDKALYTCESEALGTWLDATVAKPPTSAYDDKYNAILGALVARRAVDALPVLQRAAVEAANNGGPFNTIIEHMNEAVRPPDLGADTTPEDAKALENALVSVAEAVAPEQVAMVADRLYNAGAEAAAASLLPRVYPDRVQADGSLLYGVASIENCDGSAYIHWSWVNEPAKRWSIMTDAAPVARSFKQRLRCDTEGDWPVVATSEPVAGTGDVEAWAAELEKQWANKDLVVKLKKEKPFRLE